MERLLKIVAELKAPKNRTNTFGGYNYRSLEDILEAVKPKLKEAGLLLSLSDEVVNVGSSNYVKAIAMIKDATDGRIIQMVCAYARESVTKKGMDDSQITGTASSYARKNALNGLFLIDDTKDADTDEYKNENDKRSKKAASDAAAELTKACEEMKAVKSVEELNAVWAKYPQFQAKGSDFYDITAKVNQGLRK